MKEKLGQSKKARWRQRGIHGFQFGRKELPNFKSLAITIKLIFKKLILFFQILATTKKLERWGEGFYFILKLCYKFS